MALKYPGLLSRTLPGSTDGGTYLHQFLMSTFIFQSRELEVIFKVVEFSARFSFVTVLCVLALAIPAGCRPVIAVGGSGGHVPAIIPPSRQVAGQGKGELGLKTG